MKQASRALSRQKGLKGAGIYLKRYGSLYLLLLIPVAFFIIFRYAPMVNILIAFKQNNFIKPVWEVPWANNHGFQWFIQAFHNRDFLNALKNTIVLNLLDLVIGFPAPIILALVLNELKFKKFKSFTQTVAYMPHFLSWVIIATLALQLFAPNPPTQGLVNVFLGKFGLGPIHFLDHPTAWVATYVGLGVWQSIGWNTIIYLASITSINPELYEAATVDGAGRLSKMWHITLSEIRGTVIILLIMNLGNILGSNFDRPYTLMNGLVRNNAYVLSIFVYEYGIQALRVSLSTAVGLFQSVVGLGFVLLSNWITTRMGETGIL
jgi:putative aldouronate transport system permease protein